MKTKIIDYERSFIVFESHFVKFPPKTVSDLRQQAHNRARIRIDSLCRVTDRKGVTRDYYLGEACKTERVGAGKDLGIFTQPMPISGLSCRRRIRSLSRAGTRTTRE